MECRTQHQLQAHNRHIHIYVYNFKEVMLYTCYTHVRVKLLLTDIVYVMGLFGGSSRLNYLSSHGMKHVTHHTQIIKQIHCTHMNTLKVPPGTCIILMYNPVRCCVYHYVLCRIHVYVVYMYTYILTGITIYLYDIIIRVMRICI